MPPALPFELNVRTWDISSLLLHVRNLTRKGANEYWARPASGDRTAHSVARDLFLLRAFLFHRGYLNQPLPVHAAVVLTGFELMKKLADLVLVRADDSGLLPERVWRLACGTR